MKDDNVEVYKKQTFMDMIGEDSYMCSNDEDDNSSADEQYSEMVNKQYNNHVVNIIQKELIKYVDQKSLPLCEYLYKSKIDKFLKAILST
jgi:hypothetical protein